MLPLTPFLAFQLHCSSSTGGDRTELNLVLPVAKEGRYRMQGPETVTDSSKEFKTYLQKQTFVPGRPNCPDGST